MMNHSKIETTIIAAQQNKTLTNRQAFVTQCYQQYYKPLLIIAKSLSRDTAEAEDKLHDFFMEKLLLSNCIDAFPTTENSIESFLRVVFRNHLRSKWRKQKQYVHTHEHLDDERWNLLGEQAFDEEYIDWMAHLSLLTNQLPNKQKELIHLKVEYKSNQKIAQLTGRSIKGVKSSLSRIKTKLRKLALVQQRA